MNHYGQINLLELQRRASKLNAVDLCDSLGMVFKRRRRLSAAFNIASEADMRMLGAMFANVMNAQTRTGLVGWQGAGKSPFARGLLNETAMGGPVETTARPGRCLQGIWRRKAGGYIRVYDALYASEYSDADVKLPSYIANDVSRYQPLLDDVAEHPSHDKNNPFFRLFDQHPCRGDQG